MKTELLYLADSYAKEMDATVLDVTSESNGRWRLILDRTVFYPMGGGQPTDQGSLVSETWNGTVYMAQMSGGEAVHFVESDAEPVGGSPVHGTIDWDRRYRNMRVHSAGHVIDFAVYMLGFSPSPLSPQKGDHGKKPSIIYAGTLETDIRPDLEAKANELVAGGLALETSMVTLEELRKDAIYLQPGLPTDKPLRKLTLAGTGSVADGGTQVRNTSEIGPISIPDISVHDGMTVISYALG